MSWLLNLGAATGRRDPARDDARDHVAVFREFAGHMAAIVSRRAAR